jgi:hypothetical protein
MNRGVTDPGNSKKEDSPMNTGIVMIGLALILFSVALMVSPSDAPVPGTPSNPGCGCPFVQDTGLAGPYAGGVNAESFPAGTSTVSAP